MIDQVSNKYYIPKQVKKGHWVSVYNYRPKNESILSKKGEVFAVLSLRSDPKFDLITAGGIFLDFFHETYFEIQEASTLTALEKTVKSSGKHLEKLIDKDPNVGKSGIQLDILALSVVENYAFFVKAGDAVLEFIRDDKCVNLIPALKDPTGEKTVGVASMLLEDGDRLLIGTKDVSEKYKKVDYEKILKEYDFEVLKIDEKKDEGLAMMAVSFGEVKEEVSGEEMNVAVAGAVGGAVVADSLVEDEVEDEDLETAPEDNGLETETVPVDERIVTEEKTEEAELSELEDKKDESKEEEFDEKNEEVEDVEKSNNDEMIDEKEEVEKETKSQKTYRVMLGNLAEKIKSLPDEAKSFVNEKKTGGNVSIGKTTLPKNVIIIGIIIIVLAGGLYFGIRTAITSNQEKVQEEQAAVSLAELESLVEDIENLKSEVQSSDSNEQRQQGLDLVEEAKVELESLQGIESVATEVEQYEAQIQDAEDFFNRTVAITDATPLVDVASFFPDAVVSDLVLLGNNVYMTDSGLGKIYKVNKDGSELVEVVGDLESPSSITADDRGNLIFLDNNDDNRLGVLNPETKQISRLAGTSPDRLAQVTAIEFVNILDGRIYLVNQSGSQVMYLQRSGENYGLPVTRFELAELSTGKDLQVIDNKIYVLAEYEQGLYRFLDGQDDTPTLTGLDEGEDLLGATGLFVDGVNIYFSDPATGKVLVFDKGVESARLKGQYIARTDQQIFDSLKDLISDNSEGSLFVISNNSLYKLDLGAINEL